MWPSTFEHPKHGPSRVLGSVGDWVVFEWWNEDSSSWIRANDRLSNCNLKFEGNECAVLAAEISNWPPKAELSNMFRGAGYIVSEGKFSVRLEGIDNFVFRELDDDLRSGSVSADHRSTEEFIAFCRLVSKTLAESEVKHRFEVYSKTKDLAAYLHHDWPKD